MKLTNVYAAKRALFARLAEATAPGLPLEEIQVSYKWPGQHAVELKCAYGGGVRFSQVDHVGERGTMVLEVALVSVYIRVASPIGDGVEQTDKDCESIAAGIAEYLIKYPKLTPDLQWHSIAEGAGDYSESDDEAVSVLALQVGISSMFGFQS